VVRSNTGPGLDQLRRFYDYTLHNHLTFGHLDPDGLMFIDC